MTFSFLYISYSHTCLGRIRVLLLPPGGNMTPSQKYLKVRRNPVKQINNTINLQLKSDGKHDRISRSSRPGLLWLLKDYSVLTDSEYTVEITRDNWWRKWLRFRAQSMIWEASEAKWIWLYLCDTEIRHTGETSSLWSRSISNTFIYPYSPKSLLNAK